MELKVWVEGIQRVVCGANYSTSCQDVVLALAHAMGRTGRFTLVERWRDSERPLTPAECPLQALHKWGEYASEVRFFLIQADNSNNSSNSNNNNSIGSGSSRGSKDGDRPLGNKPLSANPKSHQMREGDGIIPRRRDTNLRQGNASGPFFPSSPTPSPRGRVQPEFKQSSSHSHLQHLQPPDHLKRSSTFSGAHNYAPDLPANNTAIPSSTQPYSNGPYRAVPHSSQHQTAPSPSAQRKLQPPTASNYGNKQQLQNTRRESRDHYQTLAPPMTNGGAGGSLSGNSSSNSSPRSPSGSSAPYPYINPGSQSQPQISTSSASMSNPSRVGHEAPTLDQRTSVARDARDIHPANLALEQSSSSSHGVGRPAGRSSQPNPDPRHRHPRRERRPRSPTPHRSGNSITGGQQNQHPQNLSSLQQSKPEQYHHPHLRSSHGQHQPPAMLPQSQDGPTRLSPPASPTPPVPAPRHRARPSPDPVEYENMSVAGRGRDPHRYQQPQQQQQQQPQEYLQHQSQHQPHGLERSRSGDRRRQHSSSAARTGAHADSRGSLPGPQSGQIGQTNSRGPISQLSSDQPMWGQTAQTGDHQSRVNPGQQLSRSLPASGMNLLRRTNENGAGSVDFVESASKRQQQQQPGWGGTVGEPHVTGGKSMSSFASAVANIRQHSKERTPRAGALHGDWQSGGEGHHQHYACPIREDASQLGPPSGLEHPGNPYLPTQTAVNARLFSEAQQQRMTNQLSSGHSSQHPPHPHNIPQKTSPREATSSPAFTLSPRPHSAFKEVSPRHGHQLSPSSPPGTSSLDQMGQHPGTGGSESPRVARQGSHLDGLQSDQHPHFRQLSLEVEEYDLDQNFPDLAHRDRDLSAGVPRMQQPHLVKPAGEPAGLAPLEYRLDGGGVRPAPHRAEAEMLQLARLVSVQQDRLRAIQAQIVDASTEVSALEEEASRTDLQLQELSVDGVELEAMEAELVAEEAELQQVEWENVLDGEQKREADIRQQMTNMEKKSKEAQERIERLKSEEEKIAKDIQAESEKLATEEQEKLKVSGCEPICNRTLPAFFTVSKSIPLSLNTTLFQDLSKYCDLQFTLIFQEEELREVESELKEENLKDFHAHPVAKEPPPGLTIVEDFVVPTSGYKKAKPYTSISSDTEDSAPETGEAIIKILESRLSPASPLIDELNNMGALTSAQQTYKSALAAKNPNGVWV
ncbi:hypothetical protein EGW08_022370 [Elysia chlorotica]|uniref:Ras-associating domain-containing protein n=1 Tax=Elysia chlorotica TaxID=188477 RepID=A0A433SL63_ELYCH|nr:hypothetical protein EGW08_022370 [Elysia chlorotica]